MQIQGGETSPAECNEMRVFDIDQETDPNQQSVTQSENHTIELVSKSSDVHSCMKKAKSEKLIRNEKFLSSAVSKESYNSKITPGDSIVHSKRRSIVRTPNVQQVEQKMKMDKLLIRQTKELLKQRYH